MKEDKTAVKTSAGKENELATENSMKKKAKEEKPPTKVVVRRLPPSMTEEQFKMQVSPMPDHDYFYFVSADMSLMPNAFSRAYINFTDQNDLFIFTEKFDGYVFVDSKGGEFPAVVEFAPFQRIPKNRPSRKKDSKVGTIEADPVYIAFKEWMEAQSLENKTAINTSKQHFFETSLASDKKEEVSNTPLLDYIRNKRAERQRIRDEKREEKRKKDLERRRAKEEQRRVKKEDETSVVKNHPSSPVKPNSKSKDDPLNLLEKEENICETYDTDEKIENKNEIVEQVPPKQINQITKTDNNEQITQKVRELVNFFSKSVNEIDKTKCNENIDSVMSNCVKHEDIEREIMKSISKEKEVMSKPLATTKNTHHATEHIQTLPKKFNKLNHSMVNCNIKESTISGPRYPIPVLESRRRLPMYAPRSARNTVYSRSNSDIVMRPVRVSSREGNGCEPDIQNFVQEGEIIRPVRPIQVSIPVVQSSRRGCDTYNQTLRRQYEVRPPVRVNVAWGNQCRIHQKDKEDILNNSVAKKSKTSEITIQKKEVSECNDKKKECDVKSVCSSDVLKKNLQKVIENVLGNTKVSNPKENIINKPKTFVRRGFYGSGDECQGKRYNSLDFYLPPRAFGFGPCEAPDSKDNKNISSRNMINAKTKGFTSLSEKTHHPSSSIPKRSLPPFSKKSASSSKSDGDIEKFETCVKIGGSEESLKRVPPQAFIIQRPLGAPRKSLVAEKNG